ncbi:MAG: glucose-1-phosphate adenylyltransferase subunit GlgD [Clostridia bacterium]|nr:glucose-1-phosphate adenylyltransferase subunit GlgD [Clostridia bacterium]
MSAAGIIFSNIHDECISELTRVRTMASVPFGGKYRLIDFPLSNMVNSNINNIKIITHYNYHSLMDHIGSGKKWDLARRNGGVKILPPFITAYANRENSLYTTRLEALRSVSASIDEIEDEYVVMSDCDIICNVNFKEIINEHISTGADITIVVKEETLNQEQAMKSVLFIADEEKRIIDVLSFPENYNGRGYVWMNILIISKRKLMSLILDATAHNYNSLIQDIIAKRLKDENYRLFAYDGYFGRVRSIPEYYSQNIALTRSNSARELFLGKNSPIYTSVPETSSTYYGNSCSVKTSMIADGCSIEGKVENSILFSGVKVDKNATVKNSILFENTIVSSNVKLNCVISDKNVVIQAGRFLSGHETAPFYIEKNKMI